MNQPAFAAVAAALVAGTLLAGCASPNTPNYDARFGDAVRQSRLQMAINPNPSSQDMSGLDGKAANEAAGRYIDSFKKPPPVVPVINIGGSLNSGGGR